MSGRLRAGAAASGGPRAWHWEAFPGRSVLTLHGGPPAPAARAGLSRRWLRAGDAPWRPGTGTEWGSFPGTGHVTRFLWG